MHEHIEPKKCKHELKYCAKCDEVYCEKCGEQWSKPFIPNTFVGDILDKKPFTPYWKEGNIMMCSHRSST